MENRNPKRLIIQSRARIQTRAHSEPRAQASGKNPEATSKKHGPGLN